MTIGQCLACEKSLPKPFSLHSLQAILLCTYNALLCHLRCCQNFTNCMRRILDKQRQDCHDLRVAHEPHFVGKDEKKWS